MTNKEIFDDAEFNAFLQGQGKLAQDLQDLPQPEPTPELDAAILRKIELALAEEAALPNAANDSAWLQRWRMPLGMAASVVLVTLMVLRQQPEFPLPEQLAQIPQAAAPAAVLGEVVAPSSSGPVIADKLVSRTERAKETLALSSVPNKPAEQLAKADTKAPEAQTAVAAASPPPSAKAEAEALAKAPMGGYTASADYADTAVDAKVALKQAAAPRAIAEPSVMGRAAPSISGVVVNEDAAKAWLERIEELLKADSHKDALAEWEKFRMAYPQYPVPEKLELRIKALKK